MAQREPPAERQGEHLVDLVITEAAEHARLVRQPEEIQVDGLRRDGPGRRPHVVEPLQHLAQGRVERRVVRVADLPDQPHERVSSHLGLVEALLAGVKPGDQVAANALQFSRAIENAAERQK